MTSMAYKARFHSRDIHDAEMPSKFQNNRAILNTDHAQTIVEALPKAWSNISLRVLLQTGPISRSCRKNVEAKLHFAITPAILSL